VTGVSWRRWVRVGLALLVVVAASATVTLLEASVLYGRVGPVESGGELAAPGQWLFAAGAVLVPSLLLSCILLPWLLFGLSREVADKERAQRDLESAHALLIRAEHMAQVGHWRMVVGPHGTSVEWSDSIFRMLGHPPQAFVPTTEKTLQSYHPDDRAEAKATFDRAMRTGEAFACELRAVTADGELRCVLTQGVVERGEDDRTVSLFGVVRDVTEARERDFALWEQNERIRIITEAVSEGVVMLDRKGCVEFWNPAAEELFGISASHAAGKVFEDLVKLEEPDGGSTTLDLLPTSEGAEVERVKCVDPRGRARTLEISRETLDAKGTERRVLLIRDVTLRAESERELRRRARFDELTGLVNRGYFWRRAGEEVERARRDGHTLSMLFVDVDHFKEVNDARGHAEGDLALTRFARCCEGRFRATDLVGRVGGEEFAVLLFGADTARATASAEKLRAAIEALEIEGSTGPFRVTASIGVAELDLDLEDPLGDAGRRADEALYAAKAAGRNRVRTAAHPARTSQHRKPKTASG
jgi:diguanylate cyclase (GGDEF)-like protein/PAS domain S-box-containing protein